MSGEPVLLDVTRAGTAVVTLNRPEVRNAFNAEVIERLTDILEDLRGAEGVRVVLIEGAGKSFSAGADIKWLQAAADYTYQDNLEDARRLADLLHRLYTLPQPTIALIDGAVRGGGNGLAAACDMAIATPKANFAFSEVKIGVAPATISPYVIKKIGEAAARRYFLTAEVFDANEALRLGLVHAVVPEKAALANESERLARLIFENGSHAITAAKELIDEVAGKPIDSHMKEETAKRIAEARATDEAREGLSAFLEKRKPSWAS